MMSVGFPRNRSDAEIWEFLLRYAVRAPSGHNTQPWRFHLAGGCLHLYADRRRALPVVDPADRERVMGCGAALAHLTVALRHFGYAGDVTPFPDPADLDLLATLRLGQAHSPRSDDLQLFEAIGHRHTHRAVFDTRPIPDQILARLGRNARLSGPDLHMLTSDDAKAAIARLVGEGDRTQFNDADFRRELASWIRPNRTRRRDGMPGYAFGIADAASLLGPTMIALFNTGARQARKDERLAASAPALLVLTTAHDTPADWLAAGQAIAVLLLRATAHGLAASFLNQPIEVPALRVRLRDLVGGGTPQLLLRIGYATTTDRPTPRRSVAEVLAGAPARPPTDGRTGDRERHDHGQAGLRRTVREGRPDRHRGRGRVRRRRWRLRHRPARTAGRGRRLRRQRPARGGLHHQGRHGALATSHRSAPDHHDGRPDRHRVPPPSAARSIPHGPPSRDRGPVSGRLGQGTRR